MGSANQDDEWAVGLGFLFYESADEEINTKSSTPSQNSTSSRPSPLPDKDDELAFVMDFFYNESADTTVRLKDDKILKFNRASLISQSKSRILYQVFCGNLRDATVTEIPDFDYDTFKLFLNCIMGYDSYNFDNALKIFPIVWKYQIQNAIDKCVKALEPTNVWSQRSSKVCDLLNMAAYLDCQKLLDQTIRFILSDSNSYRFLESYGHFLEPNSLKLMLSKVTMDSHLLDVLRNWAENYMNNCFQPLNLREFLKSNGLLECFKLEYFESTGAICKFGLSEFGKDFFSTQEILTHLQNSKTLIHGDSKWMEVEKGGTIEEEIIVPVAPNVDHISYRFTRFRIGRNKIVVYDLNPKRDVPLPCKVEIVGKNSSGDIVFEGHRDFEFSYDDSGLKYAYHSHNINGLSVYQDGWKRNIRSLEKCILKIKWTFLYDCRVLLTNRQGDEHNDPEQLFFARNVSTI